MKKLFLFSLIAGALASCSSVEIAKRQHRSGYYVSFGNKTEINKTEVKVNQTIEQQEIAQTQFETKQDVVENNIVEKEVAENNLVSNQKNEVTPSKSSKQNLFTQNLNEEKVEVKKKSTLVNKIAKKVVSGKLKQADDNIMLLILVILAIVIPPIAVGLKKNWELIPLLISILLTLFFVIPGIIHALLVVFDVI